MGLLDSILTWIRNNPGTFQFLLRETATYVDRSVVPAVQRTLENYRLAVEAREEAERERRVNELRGQIAVYTVDECLQLLDCLKQESDTNVKAQIIELVADRLKALKGGA